MLRFTKFRVNRLANRRELCSHFAYNNWKQLDTEKKWEYLQELENYFATEQGRPAVKILLDSSKNLDGNYGEYVPEENVIYINRDLVEYGTLIGPVDEQHPERLDANMQLFDTVAHEGYHAYQNYAIKHPGFHGDKKQVAEWSINDVKFFEEGDEYWVQPLERDAWKYGGEKTKEAFDEIEKYYGAEPGRKRYEETVADSSYDKALERLQAKNPDGLNQMYREMLDAYEEQYLKNNSMFNPDSVTLEQYDKTLRDQVNRYYEHLKNDPSLSKEDVMRMTSEMSEKYLASVEAYKNVQKQEEESEIRNRKEEKSEKEAESEEQDNAEDLTAGKDNAEEQSESKDNAEDLTDEKDNAEEQSENEETAEDLSNAENFAENEEEEENNVEESEKEAESEEQDNAEDLTAGKDNAEEQSESKDNAEDLTDEKDNAEEQSENEETAEDLSSAENFAENEEEEENNVEENEETEKEAESEEQDNAEDLTAGKDNAEEQSENEETAEDLSSEENFAENEEEEETEKEAESEEQDNAEDLTDGKDNAEDKSENEDNAEDLTDEKDNAEDKSKSEDNAEDLSSGEDSSTRYDGGDNDEEENESYSY